MSAEQGISVLRGTIVTGIGDYAQWITKYQEYYLAKAGIRLFPGTLNLRLDHPYELPSAKVIRLEGHEYGSRVSVSILPVRLFGRPGVILRPDPPPWATAQDAANHLTTLEVATHVAFTNVPTLPTPAGYTHVVAVTGGRTIHIAGQVPIDRHGNLVGPGDLRAQAEQVFSNLQAALAAAGATFAHVVKLNYYLLDADQVAVVRAVRDAFVNIEYPPASTLVEVRRLVRPEFLIEIEATARVPL